MAVSFQTPIKNLLTGAADTLWTLLGGTLNSYYRLQIGTTGMGNVTQCTDATQFDMNGINSAYLPGAGLSQVYTLYVSPTLGGTYVTTGVTCTINAITVSTISASQTFSTATTTTISHTITFTAGAGGTRQFAVSNSATYNTGILITWQTSNVFTLNRGTSYYFWVRHVASATFANFAGPFAIDDLTPTYTTLASSITGVGHNNTYWASWGATAPVLGGLGGGTVTGYTVAGLTAGVSTTASVTQGNATFAVNNIFSTYVTTASVSNNDVIYFQALAPNTISTAQTYGLQIGTTTATFSLTTGSILPDRLVNITTNPNTATIPSGTTSATVSITGGTSGHEYVVSSGAIFATNLSNIVAASGTGTATLTIPNANLPTDSSNWRNEIHVRVPTALGGNNVWSPFGTGTVNGGTSGDLVWFWNRASGTTLGIGTLTIDSVSTSSKELTGGATSNVSIAWTPAANHNYQILRGDLNPDVIVVAETTTSPQVLLNADANDLPVAGKTAQYSLQVRRTTANGGDNVWYNTTGTNQPFEINRIGAPVVDDTQDFDSTTSGSTFTHAVGLKVQGSGGTLQFNVTTTTTPPTTGWQTYPTNSFTLNRSTAYYFWARRSTTDATDRDISAQQTTPEPAFYGLRVFSADGTKIVFDTSSLPLNLITCKLLAGGVTVSQSINAGATCPAIYVDGMTTTNGSSIFVVVRGPQSINPTPPYTLTRQAGYFTITNNTTANATFYFFAGRYK